jgi:hypothetical protein
METTSASRSARRHFQFCDVDVPLAPWRARSPVGAGMTRANPGRVVPLAAGGRKAAGRARGCRRPALPAVVPAAAGTPCGSHPPPAGTQALTLPPGPGLAGTTAGRPPRARARTVTLAPHRHQPPAPATPCSGFPWSCPLRRGTAPARARVARLPAPPGAVTSPSIPALTPAVPETGQHRHEQDEWPSRRGAARSRGGSTFAS